MANKLKINQTEIDEFFKSLCFQDIMDSELDRNERDLLLVIFRKTIHFDKWQDRIAIYWLSQAVGISEKTLRATLKRLESKSFIDVEISKGGKSSSSKKYNGYSLNNYFLERVFRKWENIKIDNNFEY